MDPNAGLGSGLLRASFNSGLLKTAGKVQSSRKSRQIWWWTVSLARDYLGTCVCGAGGFKMWLIAGNERLVLVG